MNHWNEVHPNSVPTVEIKSKSNFYANFVHKFFVKIVAGEKELFPLTLKKVNQKIVVKIAIKNLLNSWLTK